MHSGDRRGTRGPQDLLVADPDERDGGFRQAEGEANGAII